MSDLINKYLLLLEKYKNINKKILEQKCMFENILQKYIDINNIYENKKINNNSCHTYNKLYKNTVFCIHNKNKYYCKNCDGRQLCKSEWCETNGYPKYEGYCVPCFVNNPINQNKPAMRNYKTKEKEVVDQITKSFPDFTWVSDKKVQDGCSRRRPDLLLDMGSHIIIVEVDENKHTAYDCSCENKRLMELSQDLQHRPIVFIRFNPDKYIDNNGKTRNPMLSTRLSVLKKEIEKQIKRIEKYENTEPLEVIKLYFDKIEIIN